MERPPRPSFNPAGAGGLLLAAAVLCMAAGAFVGWIAGSWGIGMLVGAIVGIPAGVVAVYRRYRGAFS